VNYIVSGLERSGTSMMMQALHSGGGPVIWDESRPADYHNPNGYFELEGGKVIRKLMDGAFPIKNFDNSIIKITSYGIKWLPNGQYKIVYMERDITEILDSTEKMAGPFEDRSEARRLLEKLDRFTVHLMNKRPDIEFIQVYHAAMIEDPVTELDKVSKFLGLPTFNVEAAAAAVDKRLYRNRKVVTI
jgi:hypothetical protein